MDETPERIWAWEWAGGSPAGGQWWPHCFDAHGEGLLTEYVRADTHNTVLDAMGALLSCPHIAERDHDPAFIEPETEVAVANAERLLAALRDKEKDQSDG